ncbi:hypothetical protein [Hwanghaeella sp.]|uniref:hypothetical protein n=1 Tax=Hwanghaeella sp. TaxID=2605943 RepID=UPI003CCB88AB
MSLTKLKMALSILILWFALGVPTQAASVSSFFPVVGGASITDATASMGLSSVLVSANGPAGLAVGGTLGSPIPGLLSTATLVPLGGSLVGGSFSVLEFTQLPPPLPPTPTSFLSGTFLDAVSGPNFIEVLFSVDGGSAASSFGAHVLMSYFSVDLGPNPLDALSLQGVLDTTGTLTFAAVTAVPIPATLPLVLTALGFLGFLKRRRSHLT